MKKTKTIAVRGSKEIIAVFSKYAELSGNQDQGRPKSLTDFVKFIAGLPLNATTKTELTRAARKKIKIHDEDLVPASLKINFEIEDKYWSKAMEVFKYSFDLKKNPQMPYFIRVSGMACIERLEQENEELGVVEENLIEEVEEVNKNVRDVEADLKAFIDLSIEDKLIKIYQLLLKERGV